jgi:hypothetical protein
LHISEGKLETLLKICTAYAVVFTTSLESEVGHSDSAMQKKDKGSMRCLIVFSNSSTKRNSPLKLWAPNPILSEYLSKKCSCNLKEWEILK